MTRRTFSDAEWEAMAAQSAREMIEDWSDADWEASIMWDLEEGSLAILAALLESGREISPAIRAEIVALIKMGGLVCTLGGEPTPVEQRRQARSDRDNTIGAWIAARWFMTKRGSMANILGAAAIEFNVSEGTAKRCFLAFRDEALAQAADPDNHLMPQFFAGNFWRAIRQFCEDRGLDYHHVHTLAYEGRAHLVKKLDLNF